MGLAELYRQVVLNESNYPELGLNTDDTISMLAGKYEVMEPYAGIYPGYSKWEDEDDERDFMFKSKDVAIEEVSRVLDMFDSLPNPIPVYRSIYVPKGEEIDMEDIGDSWSFERQSAINFGQHALGNYLLSGYVDKRDVNWADTIKLYFLNSYEHYGDAEDEIYVDGWKGHVKDIKVEPIE